MELTNALRKTVASLGSAHARRNEGCFMVEGTKSVFDTWAYFTCRYLFATAKWVDEFGKMLEGAEPIVVKNADIDRMSQLSTPSQVIAVYDMPVPSFDEQVLSTELVIALDRVQDPGNMGTIIRIADWFGIRNIICSPETVDQYNPKVIQATMGAISRVNLFYTDLAELISRHGDINVYGTFLDGKNIYHEPLATCGLLVMGNEGQGISPEIARLVGRRLLIPSFHGDGGSDTSESLNVAVATAIAVAEFRRRIL